MNRPSLVIPLVLVVTLFGAFGQTLLKLSVDRVGGAAGLSAALALLRDWAFWAGGLLVAVGGATWLYTLSRAQITFAMPFLGMGFILTMATSAVILHEPQPPIRIVGTVVIAVGMALVASSR